MEQNKLLLNLENFTSHCLKNPEIWLVLLIGPLLIRTYCVYPFMLWWSLGLSMNFCLNLTQHTVLRWFLCLSLMRWLSRESQEVSVVAAEATLLTMIASGPHCALLPLWAPPAVDGVAVAELALGAAVGLELLLELRLWIRVVLLTRSMS